MGKTSAKRQKKKRDLSVDSEDNSEYDKYLTDTHLIPNLDSTDLYKLHLQCTKNLTYKEGDPDKKDLISIITALNIIATTFVNREKSQIGKAITERPSYAHITQSQPHMIQHTKQADDTIIIKPTNNNSLTDIENKVKAIVRASGPKCKINAIINNRKVIVVKKPKDSTTASLLDEINNDISTSDLCSAYTPTLKDPTIIIKHISSGTDLNGIVNEMMNMNDELKDQSEGIRFLFPLKNNNNSLGESHRPGTIDAAFRVSPAAYEIIKTKLHMRIYLVGQCCTVRDKVFVRQCQNCFKFDHKTNDCRLAKTCRICGETKTLDHSCCNKKNCSNCSKSPQHKASTDHFPNTESCPIYKLQITRVQERTQYNTVHYPCHQ